jgi:uncharacterized protein (DUF2147 family)
MKRLLGALTVATSLFAVDLARADEPAGLWRTEAGTYQYRIARCGDAWCVYLAWVAEMSGTNKIPIPPSETGGSSG